MSYILKLPNTIKSLAISLEELGITDLAWKWGDVHQVIKFLKKNDFAILGGDVYIIENNKKNITYDSWYIDREPEQSWNEYINECEKKTVDYINEYHFNNGNNYCYSLVYKKEVEYFN